jgi:hypothetical protein
VTDGHKSLPMIIGHSNFLDSKKKKSDCLVKRNQGENVLRD